MHIQKTAGTSIVDLLRPHYQQKLISHGRYLEKVVWSEKNKLRLDGAAITEFRNIPFLSGHFGYDFARTFMQGRYAFTFLRHPIERVLSFYFFCRTRDPAEYEIYKLSQERTLDEFLQMGLEVPEVKAYVWNNQVWQFACGYGNHKNHGLASFDPEELLELAIKHLEDFSYVGFTETFNDDCSKILLDLGINSSQKRITANANPNRPTLKSLSESTLELLAELTLLDQILYESAWAKRTQLS